MCIVGLGWGRATRTTSITQAAQAAVSGEGPPADAGEGEPAGVSMGALTVDQPDAEVAPIGEEEPAELTASDLFDPATTGRVIMLWILAPTISAAASFALFSFLPLYA
jgi:PiT family inorganic phosphate transporter